MAQRMKPVAVVQGASGMAIQQLFATLVARWRPSVRMAGLLAESHGLPDRHCSAGFLRSIAGGEAFPIFQDLGPGSTACHIEGGGALAAAEAVRRDVAAGCDLVVLSKFGKLEAAGKGLRDAFAAAVEAGVPVLTSLPPAFEPAWTAFVGPSFVVLPAEDARIEEWRRAVLPRRGASAGAASLSAGS